MKRSLSFWLVMEMFAATLAAGQPIDINRLHRNSQQGIAFFIGSEQIVQGIVTVASGIFGDTLDISIQDRTGGIAVVAPFVWPGSLDMGMQIQATGLVDQVRGQTRIKIVNSDGIKILAEQKELPLPLVLTCTQVAQSMNSVGDELNENRLILLQNVRIAADNHPQYRLQDYSGECDMLIAAPSITELPDGVFDVRGILRQFDDSLPYNEGYCICPRGPFDILTPESICIISDPIETRIEPTLVEFSWETDAPSTARIEFGLTENFELGAIEDTARVKRHSLSLASLTPATLYAARVIALTPQSSDTSSVFYFGTAADQSSGEIQVYFTRSVDNDLAVAEPAMGNIDLSEILIDRIDRAQHSIDLCYYSFTHQGIAQALQRAKLRGVEIRMITDWREGETESSMITFLRETVGIYGINDRFGDNDGGGAMHNKFFVFDHRLGNIGGDDWLALGSANATYSGTRTNAENWLVINDQSLCAAYTREFNEMWGSTGKVPSGRLSRMGKNKIDNTPHRFNVNGVWIEQFMSPSDRTETHILRALASADRSAYFAQLAITSSTMRQALMNRAPHIDLRGVLNAEDENEWLAGLLRSAAVDVLLLDMGGNNLMHHKYLVVDADQPDSDPLVVTGSHNWSYAANTHNDENTLIIHDARIANLFLQEFSARYVQAGGTGDFSTRVADSPLPAKPQVVIANYPNPFNSQTCIVVQGNLEQGSRLTLTNIRGQVVAEWCLPTDREPLRQFVWRGCDQNGNSVPSGVYFIDLSGPGILHKHKVLLIR